MSKLTLKFWKDNAREWEKLITLNGHSIYKCVHSRFYEIFKGQQYMGGSTNYECAVEMVNNKTNSITQNR